MRFSANRLAMLAGINGSSSQSGALNEAGNRSKHDEDKLLYQGTDFYEKDLNEADETPALDSKILDKLAGLTGQDEIDEFLREYALTEDDQELNAEEEALMNIMGDIESPGSGPPVGEMTYYEKDDVVSDEQKAKINALEGEIVEINENMLRREIMRMRQERQRRSTGSARRSTQSLQESKLRDAIRLEIDEILNEIDLNSTASWLYGNRKPRNSKKGYVARGGFGIGF